MAFIDKRKRSREDDAYSDSSMPLSKRINNLHLTNFDEAISFDNPMQQIVSNAENPHESIVYNPELSEVENPYYWKNNKLLHDLHLERLKRCAEV